MSGAPGPAESRRHGLLTSIILYCAVHRLPVLAGVGVLLVAAGFALSAIRLDALPDLSDTQVIVFSRWDRSPDLVEDQITYPLVSVLTGAPGVRTVRGISDFGYSYVYVIFEDGVDLYWARSRTLEYISRLQANLPEGATIELGPDASSMGWVYQYALVDRNNRYDLGELRSLQDWYVRYQLQSVKGVAEVASFGGYVKQYQVQLNPNALVAYGVSLQQVVDAVRKANVETGGRLLDVAGREYMVRGRGYVGSSEDLLNTAVFADPEDGAPITLRQLGSVSIGPEIRRGVADLNGLGDTAGGIVVMRHGENALDVIGRIEQRLAELRPTLPEGVEIVTTYSRAPLIRRAIDTLVEVLLEELVIVAIVILIFLWHFPSATTAIITIPISVFLAFLPLYLLDVTANIMSLAGIAISIGVLVDGAIVQVENIYHRVQEWSQNPGEESFEGVRLRALSEVGGSIFFSLLVIAVAFLPVFALTAESGRLFHPLAYSKNLAMAIAALLAITLDPAVRMLFSRYAPFAFQPAWLARLCTTLFVGRYHSEERHPISRWLFRIYEPACRAVLQRPKAVLGGALLLLMLSIPALYLRDSEFMPPLDEGSLLYMPMTTPGISTSEVQRSLQIQNRIIKEFPEVASVHGKAGRAETATDPAPLNMIETAIELKPESEWRRTERWYSALPAWMQWPLRQLWSDRLSYAELKAKLDSALDLPGWGNVWTMPIQNRVFMLSTGMRSPIGLKMSGPDLAEIDRLALEAEQVLSAMEGVSSATAERSSGGLYLDVSFRREELARYALSMEEAQLAVSNAIGGANVSMAIEGRERYPINVRYAREFRDRPESLRRVLVSLPEGGEIPLAQIADIRIVPGPAMIRNEDGLLTVYVAVDLEERAFGRFIAAASERLRKDLPLPAGYTWRWSGQYESLEQTQSRLLWILPLTVALILALILWNTRSWARTAIVLGAVPFSLIGAIWMLAALDYSISPAVWVGIIALLGLDAETGMFMLLFLDLSVEQRRREGRLNSLSDLREALVHGAVRRIRPKIMTVASGMLGLLPIMWSDGAGADVMKRIAAPMIGGLAASFVFELLLYPVFYEIWMQRKAAQFR